MTGFLDVTSDSDSAFVRSSLPYVVRDSSLSVVAGGMVGQSPADMAEGMYSIDIMTPSGAPDTVVVNVRAGETTRIVVAHNGARDTTGPPESDTEGVFYGDGTARIRGSGANSSYGHRSAGGMFASPADGFEMAADSVQLEVESVTECEVTRQLGASGVEFAPKRDTLNAIPTAVVTVGNRRFEMSLPLNPKGGQPGTCECLVAGVREHGQESVRMSFAPERAVCVMVDGMLRNSSVHSATALFQQAAGLLFDKYKDPTGAALGGLALHGMGRLAERARWVENLAQNFPWLPEGRILRSALLVGSRDPAERRGALSMLLSATLERPLYTDGLSLAMELLRRWPDDDDSRDIRMARLDRLADLSAYADWDSTNLTTELTDQR
jgi:hypothetical protein